MREILFRGKTIYNPRWVEGYYAFDWRHWIECKSIEHPECICEAYPINPETLGQFTGVYANGVKIFEGDIVRCTWYDGITSIRVVVFEDGKFLLESDGDYIDIDLYSKEVIGNIYDNPELLEGSKA